MVARHISSGSRGLVSIAAAALTFSASAAHAFEDARYQGRFAAEFYEAGQFRSIGIATFAGTDGANFSKALATEMRAVQLNSEAWFTVKSGNNAAQSGENVADAVRAGKAMDVKAVFAGTVTTAKISRTDRSEQTTECAEGGECNKNAPRTITCTRVVLDYAVNARIIDVASARGVYNRNHVAQDGYDVCNGKGQAIKVEENKGWAVSFAEKLTGGPKREAFAMEFTEEALFQRVSANVAQKIRVDVAPFNKPVAVEFKRRASDMSKPDQTIFESGIDFSKAGRLDRACSIWELMETGAGASSVSLLYNLGVCQEYLVPENPSAALEYYVKADQLLSKPDKLVTGALLRAKTMVEGQKNIGS